MGSETPAGTMIRLLQDIRKSAEENGLTGRVVQTSRSHPPVLVLINPDVHQLSEEISCKESSPGDWWLYWSWGGRIGRATDVSGAIAVIRRVLRTRP
ncbi:hypothetical protein NE235_10240 [Actinoallomurus spadix]|uniref:Uncharacterized protein n=1 Tax=Actinoallomurus spadix TaxID=79912 RepID=A0ABP3GJB6_9ACTN|nr:hypothetical protein [Actinoallomurus spadix]MCO5986482.1 hypothetical protein [Actinoallomurus spadix]